MVKFQPFFLLCLCEPAEFVCARKPEMDLIDGLETKAVDVYSLASTERRKSFHCNFTAEREKIRSDGSLFPNPEIYSTTYH